MELNVLSKNNNVFKYGNHKIYPTDFGFDVHNILTSGISSLEFDGETNNVVHIATLGLSVEDFKEVHINDLGLKTIAYSASYELVLGANGLLTMYSGGIPAQKGFPSELDLISFPWVNPQGDTMVPEYSLFTAEEYSALLPISLGLSFRNLDLTVVKITNDSKTIFSQSYTSDGLRSCNSDYQNLGYSIYASVYPRISICDRKAIDKLKHINYMENNIVGKGTKFIKWCDSDI